MSKSNFRMIFTYFKVAYITKATIYFQNRKIRLLKFLLTCECHGEPCELTDLSIVGPLSVPSVWNF